MKKVSDLFDKDLKYQGRKNYSPARSKGRESELFDFLELIARWPEIVGDKLSKVTVPLKHQGDSLTLLTNHSAYSQQLNLLEETLKVKIFRIFPNLQGKIKKFRFIVSTQHFDKQREELLQRANSNQTKTKKAQKQNHLHPQSPEFKKLKKEAIEEFSGIEEDMEKDLSDSLISLYIQQREKDLLK